jgi:hypothetical protein
MTYTVKTRGAGGLVVAEYLCPEHGRFEAMVQRDENGDPPAEQPCPFIIAERERWDEGRHEDEDTLCEDPSPWTISAPKQKVLTVKPTAAVRGGDMKERPPWMLDTRPLAEGMKYSEWKKKQADLSRTRRHKQLVDKGVIPKKVIVG